MYGKRGVDAIVATVLIIMITVAAAAIIWAFIIPMIKESVVSSTQETAKLSIETSGGYTTWDEVQKIARVQIKRGNDNVNLIGLDFNFVKQGNSTKNQTDIVPQPNQIKVYEFNLSDFGKPEKVTVAPITASGVGSVVSESNVIKNYTGPSIPVQNQVTCISGLNSEGKIVICNCTNLQNMNQDLSASYILGKDIDCSATRTWNNGAGFIPVGNCSGPCHALVNNPLPFYGKFNGQKHTISNLYINQSTSAYTTGLFGYTHNSQISNVSLVHLNISGGTYTGGLVGYLNRTNLFYSDAQGSVNGGINTGGLIGYNYYSNTYDSFFIGDVTGSQAVGGLSSYGFYSSFNRTYATANVTGSSMVGGLIGSLYVSANLSNSFSDSNVQGTSSVGGLVGSVFACKIINSSWNNKTTNPSICYTGTISNPSCTAIQNNEAHFYSKSNAPMSSWNFTNIWQENVGSYPTLR